MIGVAILSRRIVRGSEGDEINEQQTKVSDTIQCHDYSEMMDVLNALGEQGYKATVTVGYTIRIESVPKRDETEQDGFITRKLK